MKLALVIPLALGAITILQGVINRQMSLQLGLAQTILVGSILTTVICAVFLFIVGRYPESFPALVVTKDSFVNFKLWYLLPAIFGFCIIAGMPIAISKLGAVKVTIFLVAAQMVTSVLWDVFVEKIPVTWDKVTGIVLAVSSVLLVTFKK